MANARAPDIRRVRTSGTYSLREISDLLHVHGNTVRRWLGGGLRPLDHVTPTLVHGSELRRFLKERGAKRKQTCAADEMICFRCRGPRQPVPGSAYIANRTEQTVTLRASCVTCGGQMCRAGSVKRLPELASSFGPIGAGTPRLLGHDVPLLNGDKTEDTENG